MGFSFVSDSGSAMTDPPATSEPSSGFSFIGSSESAPAQPAMGSEMKTQEKGDYVDPFASIDRENEAKGEAISAGLKHESAEALAASANFAPNRAEASDLFAALVAEKEQDLSSEYEIGEQVMRRGQVCTLMKIDHMINPPSCTVKINATGQTVETEFRFLSKLPKEPENAPIASPSGSNPVLG